MRRSRSRQAGFTVEERLRRACNQLALAADVLSLLGNMPDGGSDAFSPAAAHALAGMRRAAAEDLRKVIVTPDADALNTETRS